MIYRHQHVKRNPETGEVAWRTAFDETIPQLAGRAWLVLGDLGSRPAPTSEVDTWDDLHTPEETE